MQIEGRAAENSVEGFSQGLTIHFHSTGCRVVLLGTPVLTGLTLHFYYPNCSASIGDRSVFSGHIHFKSADASLSIGSNTRARANNFMNIAGGRVVIGDDCLFAAVRFRTSDAHTLMDAETGEVLNPPGDIIVEDRVWLADDVLLLRGAHVGADSAVGTRALVNGIIPPGSLAVGTPARVVRQGIRWKE